MSMKLFLLLVLVSAEDPGHCRDFQKGAVCALHPANIVLATSGLENEVACQSICGANDVCNFFTFFKFDNRDTLCLLLTACEDTTNCADEMGCVFAISGPSSPSILDACCSEFKPEECDSETPFMTVTEVEEAALCQDICRDEISCSFFTLFINVCFLYTNCSISSPCGLCSSGPAFPSMSECPMDTTTPAPPGGTVVLLLGGVISNENPTDSIELITTELACEADLPRLPVKTRGASAVMLGEKIVYCGGESGYSSGTTYFDTCHSLDLAGHSLWREEPTLTTTRGEFGMAVVGEKIYVTGGRKDWDNKHTSVESFHPSTGWILEGEMTMSKTRVGHCSVAINNSLFVIAGFVGGYGSTSVMKFDLGQNSSREWATMAGLEVPRFYPACSVGQYQGQTGIFVSGGQNMDDNGYTTTEKSVEFYIAEENRWTAVHRMLIVRLHHTMTEINGFMIAAGGISYSNSRTPTVEILNGTLWTQQANLTMARSSHTSVTVPRSSVSCKP